MLVYSVFLIALDGRPMVQVNFQKEDTLPDIMLLGGLLASIQMLSDEIAGEQGAAEQFTMKGITYHMKSFDQFIVVVVSTNLAKVDNLASDIGWSFLNDFGEDIDSWDNTIGYFAAFGDEIQKHVKKSGYVDLTRSVDPKKRLDTATIFNLPPSLQEAAMALISLEKASIDEIADYIQMDDEVVSGYVNFLLNEGLCGLVQESSGELKYYVIMDD